MLENIFSSSFECVFEFFFRFVITEISISRYYVYYGVSIYLRISPKPTSEKFHNTHNTMMYTLQIINSNRNKIRLKTEVK